MGVTLLAPYRHATGSVTFNRLYLPSTGAAAVSPAFGAEWDITTDADRLRCVSSKISSAMANKLANKPAANVQDQDILVRQYVSDPLAAQTISGTVKSVVRAVESATATDARAQFLIRVVSNDGSTVRGTLLAHDTTTGLVSEFSAASPTNRKFPLAWSAPGATLSSVACEAGDRLVIAFGCRIHASGTNARTVELRFGDAAASDLAEDETSTTDLNPWVEFSQAITLA